MLKNVSYNLLETITIVSKSLYRYDTYTLDAANSNPARNYGQSLKRNEKKNYRCSLKN